MNRSVLIEEVGKVKIVESPMPQRKAGEALLKLLYGGICGSDLGSFRGSFAYFDYPRVPGHEFSAEVVEVDDNAYGITKGMVVTCNPYFNCGKCYSCTRGFVNVCEDNQTMGCQRDGAFATYITMPLERIYDGKGVPAKSLALVEPYCISLHGVSRAAIQPGEKALIMGAGAIGVLAAMAAIGFGAEVTICDVAEKKLEMAKPFGVKHTILNTGPEAFAAAVEKYTDGHGYDVTIEAVGLPSTFQDCLDAVAYHGRVVVIGVGKENVDLYFTIIQKKELVMMGSRNAEKADFLATIDKLKRGELDLDRIVTNHYDFDEAVAAFEDFDKHQQDMLKVLIKF